MTVTYLGELSISAAVPLLAEFSAGFATANGFATPQLNAQLGGLNNVLAAITVSPPALADTILAAQKTVLSLQAAIGGPTVTLQPVAIATQIAALTAILNSLTALAGALIIPSASISAYVFDGASSALGAELQAQLNVTMPGVGGHANAIILATSSPSAWAAMQTVFAT